VIKTSITVFLISLFITPQQIFSQSVNESVSLVLILEELQEKYDCSFTYIDKDISEINLQKPSKSIGLKETIAYLRINTPLTYTFVSPTNIVLSINKVKEYKICGTIISKIDNTILIGATVETKNKSTISDQQGNFSFIVDARKQWVTFKHIGYKPLQILAEDLINESCETIILTPEVQFLREVILNDYLVKGISKKSDGSTIIDYTDFGILPGLIEPDLLQTIQALPGVLSVSETVSDINVRGGTNDQNLILWDGVKMYQSGHFFGLISAFNPYLTKNVQLSRNGSSASYGDGVSSVIAMNTTNKINTELDASLGVNMISADGYIDVPLGEKSSLQVSARKSINEIIETPTYNRFFDKAFQDSEVTNPMDNVSSTDQEFSFYDASIRWLYQLNAKNLIKVNAITMQNNLTFEENALIDQTTISRESSAKQSNVAGSITYLRNWNTRFKSEILLYGTNYDLQTTNSDIIKNQRLLQKNEVLESGVKVNAILKLNRDINLRSGYQFNETGISNLRDINNPTFRDFVKEVIRTNSIFSEIEFKSHNNNTHLKFGTRLNHFDKFNTFFIEPRLSINHRFNNHFTVEILGELKSQVTSQIIESQNDFLGVENRKWILSNNTTIPILKSQQISFGLSYNHNNWLISTDVFHKNIDGIIARSQGFQNQFEFKGDQGSYTINGIDFLINKRFKNFGTWLSYSFAENNYTFKKLSEKDFPNNIDIRHNVNFAVGYTIKNFKCSTGINWHSGKPTTRPVSGNEINNDNTINFSIPNGENLEDYWRWDISTTYKFKLSNKTSGLLGVSLWNILNQKNIVNNYYRLEDADIISEVNQLGLAATPNILARINF